MAQPWSPPPAPPAEGAAPGASPERTRRLAERVPDLLPLLALLAAGVARLFPARTPASRVDALLAILVLVTALGIDPRRLLTISARWRTVVSLAALPLLALAIGGWALGQLVGGDTRNGVLALGLSPSEVASVGLVGLLGAGAEVAIAVLALSLVLSAVLGPPALALLAGGHHAAHTAALLGRFGLVVILPLAVGLAVRGTRPGLGRREGELSLLSTGAVVALIYVSLSDAGGDLVAATLISAAFLVLSAVLAVGILSALGDTAERSLGLTVGMRDFAVAAALATGAFGGAAGQVPGVYGVLMLLAGASVTGLARRSARRRGSRTRAPN